MAQPASAQHLRHGPPFEGAGLHIRRPTVSVLPSSNQRVRLLTQRPALADTSGLADHRSFNGQVSCSAPSSICDYLELVLSYSGKSIGSLRREWLRVHVSY